MQNRKDLSSRRKDLHSALYCHPPPVAADLQAQNGAHLKGHYATAEGAQLEGMAIFRRMRVSVWKRS